MTNINFKHSSYRSHFRTSSIKKSGPKVAADVMRFDISQTTIMFGLLFMAAILGVLYLFTFNNVSTKGYELRRLEISRQELKKQHDLNNLALAKAKSLDYMIESNNLDAMIKANNVEFVYADSVLAKAD